MSRTKAAKPEFKYINTATISQDIDNCVLEYFSRYSLDVFDLSQRKYITHNILTGCMKYIYNKLFKPSQGLYNNQHSLIDYDDIEQLKTIADKFIELSLEFNKSLGLMQFSIMSGIHRSTLAEWRDNRELNPIRSDIINNICECHKMEQIGLLNDSPVGALAVANNDIETGLEWSKQQALTQANNTVYILSSERLQGLGLPKADREELVTPD